MVMLKLDKITKKPKRNKKVFNNSLPLLDTGRKKKFFLFNCRLKFEIFFLVQKFTKCSSNVPNFAVADDKVF